MDCRADRRQAVRGFLEARRDRLGQALCLEPPPLVDGEGKLLLIGLDDHFATREWRRQQGVEDKRWFAHGGRRPEPPPH